MHTPNLIKEACKGKQKVVEFEVGTCSRPSETEEDHAHLEIMKSLSEVEVLKKFLQYCKEQNRYLNYSSENLMTANRRLREDLEEIDANYQELITVSKEFLRRKRDTEQQNEELISINKELQDQIRSTEAEHFQLQKISQALDGLMILVEATRKLLLIVDKSNSRAKSYLLDILDDRVVMS